MSLTITLPRLHNAQWEIASSPARFRVAACGRRFGKTLEAGGEAVKAALPGQVVWWVAPSYDVTRRGWKGVITIANQIPGTEIRLGVREVVFPSGGFIGFKTADSATSLKGEGLDFVIVDEAAYVREEAWTQDLRPALSDRLGRALFISTPNGRNWFWRAYMRGLDPEQADWQSWRFPTVANPFILPSEVEDARQLLPERIFKQEYLAEFTEDAGTVFRNLIECTTAERQSEPIENHQYCFGVDWGRDNDFTAIAIFDMTARALADLDRFNEIGWALQRGRLMAAYEKWQPESVWAEANSIGGPNIEALQNDGIPVQPFTTTAQSKGPLIESLALAFERSEISIFSDPVLSSELQAYEINRLPSGRYQYSAPDGMHDDTVIALALSWHGSMHSGPVLSFV